MTTTFVQPTSAPDDGRPPSPVPVPSEVTVLPGPALLSGIEQGPSLVVHREQYGAPPLLDRSALLADLHRIGLRGRGGAGFPFATKVEALGRGRPVLVVNLSEGEPYLPARRATSRKFTSASQRKPAPATSQNRTHARNALGEVARRTWMDSLLLGNSTEPSRIPVMPK